MRKLLSSLILAVGIVLAVRMHLDLGGEFNVLIVEESADRHLLAPSQLNMYTSVSLRKWIEANGGHLYIWDDDVETSDENPQIVKLLKKAKTPLPQVVTGTGLVEPLPMTEEQLIKDLTHYVK